MSALQRLVEELERRLGTGDLSYTTASKLEDVYEGYLFALVVSTASRHGAKVTYRDVDGAEVTSLVFRTSPGLLHSTERAYTYAELNFPAAPALEVHVGVRVAGESAVLHECDVLVLPASEAERVRRAAKANHPIAPTGRLCLLAIECKFYGKGLGIGLARSFEGLQADLGARHSLFVTNAESRSINTYLNARARQFEHHVTPGEPQQVSYTQGHIRAAFKDFLARHAPGTPI